MKTRGKRWVLDHWKARRTLDIPAVHGVPENIRAVKEANAMVDREADLYHIITDSPGMPDPTVQPGLELKHSACRVVKPAQTRRRRAGATSCLLPGSRLLLLQPLVPSPRYLTGCEGMAVQGIHHNFTAGDPVLSDAQYLHLAGNAFCGGSCAIVILAAVSFLDPSSL